MLLRLLLLRRGRLNGRRERDAGNEQEGTNDSVADHDSSIIRWQSMHKKEENGNAPFSWWEAGLS
jgi:hypothetical protein